MVRTRILIADDHPIVRKGVRWLLESHAGWEICGEAATGIEAVKMAERLRPNVIVMDITMPELNGLDATRQILQLIPRVEVLVLTMHESEQTARELLSAGARGFVLKSDADATLVSAVETLCQHKPFLTPHVAEFVLDTYVGFQRSGSETDPDRLTGREREIVQLLSEGKANKEVAASLGISVKTVETHRARVMSKLRLRSLSDLVKYAIRNRMIQA